MAHDRALTGAPNLVLAGDVGGTNARLAICEPQHRPAARPRIVWSRSYPSREHAGLLDVARLALEESGARVAAASFGVAGPVVDAQARGTNLPWTVDARELARALDLPRVGLLNDLEAMAWGIAALAPEDYRVLQAGAPRIEGACGPMAIVAAGTGLGEAGLAWDGVRHIPFACEGGHATFAPRGERERRLGAWLEARHGHVSWERVVSGQGLANIDEFLAQERGLARRREPAVVTRLALADHGADAGAAEALELFCSLWGAESANLALKLLATGGVWLGGGIAPKVLPALERGGCLAAFLDKGRLRPLLERVPLCVILNESTGLLGAARHALARCGS